MEYRAYAITVRPHGGVTDAQIAGVLKMVRRRCDYYTIITEKTGEERHLHAGLFLKKPEQRKYMNQCLKNMTCFKDLTKNEQFVLANGTKIMYNMDFVDNYMTKDDETQLIAAEPPPPGVAEQYFPPPEEQEKAMRAARINKAKNSHMAMLEEYWNEFYPDKPKTMSNCVDHLASLMFEKRLIKGYRDMQTLKKTATMFCHYVNKRGNLTEWEDWQRDIIWKPGQSIPPEP